MSEVKFEGFEEFEKALEALGNADAVEAALQKACALVERSAKQKAPKGIGELRRSIQSKIDTDTDTIKGVVFTPLLYAPYVEFGTGLFAEDGGRQEVPWRYKDDEGKWHSTSGMRPTPYMRPALEENREEIIRILKEGMHND